MIEDFRVSPRFREFPPDYAHLNPERTNVGNHHMLLLPPLPFFPLLSFFVKLECLETFTTLPLSSLFFLGPIRLNPNPLLPPPLLLRPPT